MRPLRLQIPHRVVLHSRPSDERRGLNLFIREADGALQRRMQEVFRDAPSGPESQRLFDRRVRGSWVPLDLTGDSDAELFAGVLDESLRPEEVMRADRVWGRLSDSPFDVDVAGRVMIAVARSRGATERPSWNELREYLE